MARSAIATFCAVLDGISVARIAITGAAADREFPVHIASNDAEIEPKHLYRRTLSADHPVAGALWASLSDAGRDSVRKLEPELAAELDASAGGSAEPRPDAAARATADAARRARNARSTEPPAGTPTDDERDA